MTTNFPTSIDSYTTKVDNVTEIEASHINDLQDAMVAVQTHVINSPDPPNLLYHSLLHAALWQEGTTFNDIADDTYVADLWKVIHNGQTPDISQDIENGVARLRCLFDSAASQVGFLQFLEAKDTLALQGKTLSFGIDLDNDSALAIDMRVALLGWSGTADSITSDVVSSWATGNPTLATNWEYISTPADLNSATVTRLTFEGVSFSDTDINNLAVFVWTPDEQASGDDFKISKAKLEIGATATDFVARTFAEELAIVQRFYEKSYELATAPGTNTNTAVEQNITRAAVAGSTAGFLRDMMVNFMVRKRVAPTMVLYAQDGTANAITNVTAGVVNRTGATASLQSEKRMPQIGLDNTSAQAIAADDIIRFHYTADARL